MQLTAFVIAPCRLYARTGARHALAAGRVTHPPARWRMGGERGARTATKARPSSDTARRGTVKRGKKGSGSAALAAALEKYEPVIGVEVHVQLATRTKAYCACSTSKARIPNSNVCPVCMGHPGALPVLNAKVVELAAKAGMALDCTVSTVSTFDRKNYYYADTPKNYQITQADNPIAQDGAIELGITGKTVRVQRLHIEEDSAKMTHEGDGRLGASTGSFVDFNRAGIPLIEIVSHPDMRSGAEAAEYGQELQRILRYVGASDCNMQDGSLRCDVNVSIRERDAEQFGTRVELKNLNSFGAVQKAVDYEVERQAAVLDSGEAVTMETRTWDEKNSKTLLMRAKEETADYRYFPEPDLPPLRIAEAQLQQWRADLPELPHAKRVRFRDAYALSDYDAFLLAADVATGDYLDATVSAGADPKAAANWIMGDITKVLKYEKMSIDECKLSAKNLAAMLNMIEAGDITGKIAKDLIIELVTVGGSPVQIVEERNLSVIRDAGELEGLIRGVLESNTKELEAYRGGKKKLMGFFVGQVMKASEGRADPQTANTTLRKLLDE